MRPCCPVCGEPSDDDGDRFYDDECDVCGWRSVYRRARDEHNAAVFVAARQGKPRPMLPDALKGVYREPS